jgi:hypothetical protein
MGLMKHHHLYLCLLLSTSFLTVNAAVKDDEEKAPTPIVLNDSLKKLVEIDGVKPIYEDCNTKHGVEVSDRAERVFECLWSAVKKNTGLVKKVKEAYAEEIKNDKKVVKDQSQSPTAATPSRAPASEQTNLSDKKIVVQTNYSADPAIQALSSFYGKKLDEILDPDKALTAEERKNGTILTVDHKKFIELYKTELGRAIVGAFTSYCLDAGPDPKYEIDSDPIKRQKQRDDNLKQVAAADLNIDNPQSKRWMGCIKNVASKCKYDSNSKTTDLEGSLANAANETSKRACLVVDFVEASRRNLIASDKQIEDYKLLSAKDGIGIVSNTKEITDLKKTSNDSLLEMTSKDVKDSLKGPMEKDKLAFEECFKDGVIVNAEICKKYLDTNKDGNSLALAEMGMRKIAQEETLRDELQSDTKVKSYLLEEGYSKDEVASMTKDKSSTETVKKEILARYAAQKAAIIKEMAAKIESKTASTQGKIEIKNDKTKLETIKDGIASRSEDLEGLVKFNNIVSSYLQVEDKNSKDGPQRNTASLYAEANSMSDEDKKVLMKNIEAAHLTDQKGKSSGSDLNVDTLNKNLINYDLKKKP